MSLFHPHGLVCDGYQVNLRILAGPYIDNPLFPSYDLIRQDIIQRGMLFHVLWRGLPIRIPLVRSGILTDLLLVNNKKRNNTHG